MKRGRSDSCLYQRLDIGAYAQVFQSCDAQLSDLVITHPMLILVTDGYKQMMFSGQEIRVKSNQAVFIPANQTVSVLNKMTQSKQYRAFWFSWGQKTLNTFLSLNKQTHSMHTKNVSLLDSLPEPFLQSLNHVAHTFQVKEQISDEIMIHQMMELLIWLQQFNINVLPNQKNTLNIKIRQLVENQLEKKWSAVQIAKCMAMSEATLRRHLAEEQLTLTQLMIDIRMSHGLTLLQSTNWPVMQIAQSVGYESASRFSMRFRQKFGISPLQIRG